MCQLRCIATWGRRRPASHFPFRYETPVPSLKSVNLSLAVVQRFHMLIPYFTLWPWSWPLTFDLEYF